MREYDAGCMDCLVVTEHMVILHNFDRRRPSFSVSPFSLESKPLEVLEHYEKPGISEGRQKLRFIDPHDRRRTHSNCLNIYSQAGSTKPLGNGMFNLFCTHGAHL